MQLASRNAPFYKEYMLENTRLMYGHSFLTACIMGKGINDVSPSMHASHVIRSYYSIRSSYSFYFHFLIKNVIISDILNIEMTYSRYGSYFKRIFFSGFRFPLSSKSVLFSIVLIVYSWLFIVHGG